MNRKIPEILYWGHIVDCYIGRVSRIYRPEYKLMPLCKLELVKELIPNKHPHLSLSEDVFTDMNETESFSETHVPAIGQLIQVLIVGDNYGCKEYVQFLDKVEDAAPVPKMYEELVATVPSNLA